MAPPLHDFRCMACGAAFESLTSPHEPVECPLCKHRKVDRLPCVVKSYTIKGDNSSSVTPKRHRGEVIH